MSQEQKGTRAIASFIYRADVDPTNPLRFGLLGRQLYVFRNGTTF